MDAIIGTGNLSRRQYGVKIQRNIAIPTREGFDIDVDKLLYLFVIDGQFLIERGKGEQHLIELVGGHPGGNSVEVIEVHHLTFADTRQSNIPRRHPSAETDGRSGRGLYQGISLRYLRLRPDR